MPWSTQNNGTPAPRELVFHCSSFGRGERDNKKGGEQQCVGKGKGSGGGGREDAKKNGQKNKGKGVLEIFL